MITIQFTVMIMINLIILSWCVVATRGYDEDKNELQIEKLFSDTSDIEVANRKIMRFLEVPEDDEIDPSPLQSVCLILKKVIKDLEEANEKIKEIKSETPSERLHREMDERWDERMRDAERSLREMNERCEKFSRDDEKRERDAERSRREANERWDKCSRDWKRDAEKRERDDLVSGPIIAIAYSIIFSIFRHGNPAKWTAVNRYLCLKDAIGMVTIQSTFLENGVLCTMFCCQFISNEY